MHKLIQISAVLMAFTMAVCAQNAILFTNKTYIEIPADTILNPPNELTVEMWIHVDSLVTSQNGIVGTWDDNTGAFRTYALWIFNQSLQFLISRNRSESPRASAVLPAVGEWLHVAGVYNSATANLYIGDSLYATTSLPGVLATNSRPLFIGKTETGSNGPDYFYGVIDELRIWNTARNVDQLRSTMYDTLSPDYYTTADSGLVAYYRFEEFEDLGVGDDGADDVRDYSIYQNHGDVVGDPLLTDLNLPTKITSAGTSATEGYDLYQNYPNPFNPVTRITFTMLQSGYVILHVYNIVGQEVLTLLDQNLTSGVHEVLFDASQFPSGIYFYQIQTGSFSAVKKMIFLK